VLVEQCAKAGEVVRVGAPLYKLQIGGAASTEAAKAPSKAAASTANASTTGTINANKSTSSNIPPPAAKRKKRNFVISVKLILRSSRR
jgi:pyruvate/2-oxoglutarate dehydrogenase complex dihydrolipoamide acyltransferase (E2) component